MPREEAARRKPVPADVESFTRVAFDVTEGVVQHEMQSTLVPMEETTTILHHFKEEVEHELLAHESIRASTVFDVSRNCIESVVKRQ